MPRNFCCRPTCACCPGLGVPAELEVEVANVENIYVPERPCDNCDGLNGLWHPTYYKDHLEPGESALTHCWFHQSLTDPDLIDCDAGSAGWWTCCGPDDEPVTSIDLWVRLVCDWNASVYLSAMIISNRPTDPFPESGGACLASPCICLGLATWQMAGTYTDPCEMTREFCDPLLNGVDLVIPDYLGCVGTSGCTDGFLNPGGPNEGNPDYRLKFTVKRL